MENENYSTAFYKARLAELSIELKKYSRRSKIWAIIRLITFIGVAVLAYTTYPYNGYSVLMIITSLLLFLYFVRKSAENKEQLNFVKALILINENEIKSSKQDYSAFNDGKEYIDPNHAFSYDMDVFGENSFFQLFNRTVTQTGEKKLVAYLLNGTQNRKENIEAIDELTEHKTWYQGYLAYGSTLEKDEAEVNISEVIEKPFPYQSWVKVARFVLPIFAISISALYYFDIISGLQFLIAAVLLLLPIRQTLKTTNEAHKALSNIGKRAKAISNQLEYMETVSFKSDLLKQYQNELFKQKENGKVGLKKLSQLVKEAEYRDNILVAIFLNFFFAWDLRLLMKIKEWKDVYGDKVKRWEEIVYDMESLISGANFRMNFKDHTTIPEITQNEQEEHIKLVELGHPIIPLKKLIKNNFILPPTKQFAIITGPNMAGKSTFLRSIGINLMLAHAGFHVFAKEFVFPNRKLYSSMRTSDNLKDETSYFHAELLRLRFIMDAIEQGEQVFIILDEILKGTNSKDKEEGSSKFLQKLNQLKVKGIIATHDLSLTNLTDQYPSIINQYFDTEIKGEEISFDYTIRDGVAKNMNASFLLRKMGLIDK